MTERSDGMAIGPTSLFDRCVETKLMRDGRVEVHCKLGLWSVSANNRAVAEHEAQHYWRQYYADGEYAPLLSNTRIDQE
jgi:hypothetical protein